ncbi:NAD-dependent epimerase/dehydratase family protein [Aurantiacibacter hainanensis]|uniref:NAD-dependent epimerase/dehydratase family protein n=1 Tax=Aurantiacibacter hainanensis TaxID=3076114 RepID=UPI0030C6DFE9
MIVHSDVEQAVKALEHVWPALDGARIFMTGGTGFIGRWMLEVLARAPIDVEAVLLTRNPAAFATRAPHLAARFDLLAGDTATFAFPRCRFTHVVHGATDASAALTASDPRRMFDTIVRGTRRTLDLARFSGAGRYLLMSSGAVYGAQPADVEHVTEDWRGGPDLGDPRSAYAEGKRAAETLCTIYGAQFGLATASARIFALLGPLLPLDTHFAAGNFIRDAVAGRRIQVQGSGQAVRSYLYPADLAVWLWTMLARAGAGSAYNCGSEEAVSVADLAHRTARILGNPGVDVLGAPDAGWNPGRYVPSTAAIARDLGLRLTVPLDEAIRRTALANGWNP